MENGSKSMAPDDEPVQVLRVGQPFEIEQVIDVVSSAVESLGEASDGYIKDLEPIPPLKELSILWNKSITKLLPVRR
jgi:hypothetical protein